jgi:hypothetical protein
VAVPWETAVANPEAFIVATEVELADHVTEVVQFDVEPSEYVQVAEYCWVEVACMVAVAGETPMVRN